MKKKSTHASCSAAIKAELKNIFPDVKFSVTSDSFSMGNSVRIAWNDGPTVEQVEEITGKYQYGHFDGMQDLYEYSNKRDDIPQAKYVTETRTMSDATRQALEQSEALKDNDQRGDIVYRLFYKTAIPVTATNITIEHSGETAGTIESFYRIAYDMPEAESRPTEIETKSGEVSIIEYSAKAIAVVGDTKPIKDKLKELGGKFNFRLTCGPGWIFPKSKLETIQQALTA